MRRMNAAADFRQRFTALRRLPVTSFDNALFFECAPLHVILVTLFYDGAGIASLKPDRDLIAKVSAACSLEAVESAIDDYCWRLRCEGWARRFARFRISTRKLHRVAQQCLPSRTETR
jgi:hypothetical protein